MAERGQSKNKTGLFKLSRTLKSPPGRKERKREKSKGKKSGTCFYCAEDCCSANPDGKHNHRCRCLKHFDEYMQNKGNRRKSERRRDLSKERGGIKTAPSGAMSSFKALFFHDIPPEVFFALANRYTGGHRKYGVGHVNINWKIGLNDPEYIADRFNHAMTHLISTMDEDLRNQDDHLEGAFWNVAFLITARKRFPEAYREAFIQGNLVAELAKKLQERMKKACHSMRK